MLRSIIKGDAMPSIIVKIKLVNYKRFKHYTIIPKKQINILAGDNEVGKSSVLEAIDLVASGNIRRIEAIGIDRLLNIESVNQFKAGDRAYEDLPKMIAELYLEDDFDHTMNGKNNTDGIVCDGIRLVCEPNQDYKSEIIESLQEQSDYFPYDYYSIRFSTFGDEGYTGYKKKLRSVFIDSSSMNSDYATNDFIKRMYSKYTESNTKERAVHKSKYRQLKNSFSGNNLQALNHRIPSNKNYIFGLKNTIALESDLMIFENEISIDSKGAGKQVFIKTDFALERSGANVDVVLIEEPENHLSHINLRKLIELVAKAKGGQLFIATHSSHISTRLELRNLLIMYGDNSDKPTSLGELDEDTEKYFMKAPVAGILEFAISNKVILVEGPSEYMLFEKFYEAISGKKPEMDGVHIIDIRGLSFKRYLNIAKLTKSKIAVITDNDGNKQRYCEDKYTEFLSEDNIKIFYEADEEKYTFEVVLHSVNEDICKQLFGDNALEYMLKNKTEAAFTLLEQDKNLTVPQYIKGAIEWIKE